VCAKLTTKQSFSVGPIERHDCSHYLIKHLRAHRVSIYPHPLPLCFLLSHRTHPLAPIHLWSFLFSLSQCSQRGSPSVFSQDEDGRRFAVPSRPPAKLPDDAEWRTSGPAVPHYDSTPVMPQLSPLILCARI